MLNDAAKLSDWTEKLKTAKQALFTDEDDLGTKSSDSPLSDRPRRARSDISGSDRLLVTTAQDMVVDAAKNSAVPEVIHPDVEKEEAEPYLAPLMTDFDIYYDYVELEYMVIADPVTGKTVEPVVTVTPSEDGKAGVIRLNGKIVASVDGGQELKTSDVKLVRVEA